MKNLRPALLLAGALCGASAGDAPDVELASLVGMSLADMLEVDLGTGTSKFVRQAPAVAYVISGDDIRRLGARNLLEVLQGVPGFFLYNLRANFNEPVADLRGGFSERGGQVLFMLDGRPLRMVDNVTMPEILRLPMHLVERVEVVRGPVSALYGADALTGAVNVITKKHPDEAGISTGSFGQRELWAGKSGRSGPFDWAISANHSRERETLTTQILRQPVRSYTSSLEREYRDLTLRLTAGPWSLTTWAMRSGKDEAGGPPAQGPQGQPFAPPQGAPAQEPPPSQTQGRSRHQHLELAYADRIDDKTDLRASVVHTTFEGGMTSAADLGVVRPKRGETHQSADLTLTRSLLEAHRLRLNLGLTRERRERGDNPPGPQFGAREGRSLVLQDEYAFAPDWELTAGWRIDHFSDFGSVNNPRLGLVWNTSAVLTSKLMFGQAFRPPVFTGDDPVARQVTSEKMRNIELAFDLRPHEQLRTALNLYRYRAHDLYVAGDGNLPPAERDGRGAELELSWLATPALRVEASASLSGVVDSQTGIQVPYTPRKSAKLGLDWRAAPGWAANLRWEGYWGRERDARDLRPPFGRLCLLNGNVRHDLSPTVSLAFSARNLLNNRSYVPILNQSMSDQMQLPERNFLVQLEKRF